MWGEIAALLFNSKMGCSDDRARSMVVLVEFPNGADKNTQAAGTVRFHGLRRKRLYWEFSWIVLS